MRRASSPPTPTDEHIFTEYDTCDVCQSFELKPKNLQTISQHLLDLHNQMDIALYVCSRKAGFRQVFLNIYNETKPYQEPNFDHDLKKAFYAKCWEMLTCRALLRSGIVPKANVSQLGPDFTTDAAYVECINVEPDSEYISKIASSVGVFEEVPEDEIQLRITNGLDKKLKAFNGYLDKGILDRSKERIIAINYSRAHDFAFADSDGLSDNFVLRSLFGMGPQEVVLDGNHSHEVRISFKPHIEKTQGVLVPTDLFLTKSYSQISGVIYSNHQITSDQSAELSIVNNPYAEVPLDINKYTAFHRIKADKLKGTLTKHPKLNS